METDIELKVILKRIICEYNSFCNEPLIKDKNINIQTITSGLNRLHHAIKEGEKFLEEREESKYET